MPKPILTIITKIRASVLFTQDTSSAKMVKAGSANWTGTWLNTKMWENYVYSFTHRFIIQVSSWGTGIGVAFGHFLCPLSGDFNHKVCPKLWSHYSQNGIFYQVEPFSSPKGQEFDQKIAKKGKKSKSNATTMPMSPPRSIQTLIPTLMGRCYAFNLWALRQKTPQSVMEIKKFKEDKTVLWLTCFTSYVNVVVLREEHSFLQHT